MAILIILFMSVFSSPASSEMWQCTNKQEIRCSGENCKVEKEGEFTPMSVFFDKKGKMSVCAYTGCWEGTGNVMTSINFVYLTGKSLPFSTAPDSKQNISITLDTSDNIALLKAGEFSHPLVCKIVENKPSSNR
jgi:hypothetical protein